MDVTIPYTPALHLGRAIDARTLKPGLVLPRSEISPKSSKVNLTTLQYSFVETFRDVCDVLAVPPEYALKVETNIIKNEIVYSCLKALNVKDSFTLIFRGSFIHQRRYVPNNNNALFLTHLKGTRDKSSAEVFEDSGKPETQISPNGEQESSAQVLEDSGKPETQISPNGERELSAQVSEDSGKPCIPSTENVLANASGDDDVKQSSPSTYKDTHWIKAVETGNEIVLLVTVVKPDPKKLDKIRTKWTECLGPCHGCISRDQFEDLKKVVLKTDKKLSNKYHDGTRLEVNFFHTPNSYPKTMSGVVTALEDFLDQCEEWTQMGSQKMGETDQREERSLWRGWRGLKETLVSYVRGPGKESEEDSSESDEEQTGEPSPFHVLRVTMRTLEGDESDAVLNGTAQSQYPQSTSKPYEDLHRLLISCEEATAELQSFLGNLRINKNFGQSEGIRLLSSIQETRTVVLDSVRQFDLITVPDFLTIADICSAQPLDTVNTFIEDVTTKLPPGGDIDLLLIGKTGHGKSSTGNSILDYKHFHSSADGQSVTSTSDVGWAEVDNRIIKVVDTPGMCDTSFSAEKDLKDTKSSTSKKKSIDLASRSFAQAIVHCPRGFHALLLILRFGTRMTQEEKDAIDHLKSALGENIIKDHGICVITYGESFDLEMAESKKTFEQWCRSQGGFLEELFVECDFRCVLFKNKTTDAKVKKTQLINLVAIVDNLESRGTRYTHELFEVAKRECESIQRQQRIAKIKEELECDLHLMNVSLMKVVEIKDETRYKNELMKIKKKLGNLKDRISEENKEGKLDDLVKNIEDTSKALEKNQFKRDDDEINKHRQKVNDSVQRQVIEPQNRVKEEASRCVQQQVAQDDCFPGCSQVCLKDGRCVSLQQLKVGDQVLVRNAKGHLIYDTVYMFGHCDDEASTQFVVLETGETEYVRVSSQHYVFCKREGVEVCMTAEEVRVGDQLLRLVCQDESKAFEAVCVQGKRVERLQGLFAPFTMEGTIVVDNHLMSCYVQCVSHNTAHLLLGPVRQLYKISPNTLAIVNNLGQLQGEKNVPWWARVALKALRG